MSFRIGDKDFTTRRVHGRLYLNSKELGAICHPDRGVVEYSDLLGPEGVADAVAGAVCAAWQELGVTAFLAPSRPGYANAADGEKFHAAKQRRQ